METNDIINSFVKLGNHIRSFLLADKNGKIELKLADAVQQAEIQNPWFTKDNIYYALNVISEQLTENNLLEWIKKYPELKLNKNPKNIGVVMAGNIPMIGFHDFICVLISGNKFIGKLSSKDNILLKKIADILISIDDRCKDRIIFETGFLKNFNAVIATGSDNSSMYFEQYFKNVPNIIRKNRNSVAILTGQENEDELKKLGADIFTYFGLGCRSVSKLYVPENYDFTHFFNAIKHFSKIKMHNKYTNNYLYNQTVYLMNNIRHLDNGFVILKEDNDFSSPISVIFYEYYKNIRNLYGYLESNSTKLQCVVTNADGISNSVLIGETQKTKLWNYADNVDTIKFLTTLNNSYGL